MRERIVVSWSGGKDSALMLDRLLRDERYEVVALVTTVDAASQRVSAHGVRRDLIARQAEAIGLPLLVVELPPQPSNDVYIARFAETLAPLQREGVCGASFGDLFLADLRAWRERSFAAIGLSSIFPLWGEASHALADAFTARGFAAVLCCVNGAYLDRGYLGRLYDARLFASLPDGVDRCGENGEFHTFTFEGPIFREPVRYAAGATRYEPLMAGSRVPGHWFCDLRPTETRSTTCPLCGGDNECAMTTGEPVCWCFSERIPSAVRERIPPYARDVTCICRACVRGESVEAEGTP